MGDLCHWIFHPAMSNIIPLPFESLLSLSYADASEFAQAMQHLECHLVHVVNIWVTSKLFDYQLFFGGMLTLVCRPVRIMAPSLGGRTISNEGADGSSGPGESGDRGDDGSIAHGVQF